MSAYHAYRIGVARVLLSRLDFEFCATSAPERPLNVARLKHIFEIENCQRDDPDNFVPVVISNNVLNDALTRSNLTVANLGLLNDLRLLQINHDERLRVLHGRHRLHAASQFLGGVERWWTVELYRDNLSNIAREQLETRYSKSSNLSDGEIYRRLRQAQLGERDVAEKKWLARLSEVKRRDVSQLHRRQVEITTALDGLLPYHGLWNSVELGTLHRILTIRCPQEVVRYLTTTRRIWEFIFSDDDDLASHLDSGTVKAIETLHPTLSTTDWEHINDLMARRKIFVFVEDAGARARILNRIGNLTEPILSLHTFLEDTKFLEVMTKPLRRLIPVCRMSIRESLMTMYEEDANRDVLVQVSDTDLNFRRFSNETQDRFRLHFFQLILYCMRHFYALTGTSPRREKKAFLDIVSINPNIASANLARLASSLGFRSDVIEELSTQHAEEYASAEFLLEVRPLQEYNFPDRLNVAATMSDRIRSVNRLNDQISFPHLTTDLLPLDKCHRMGRPFDTDQKRDQKHCFLQTFAGQVEAPQAQYLTSLAVKRYVFRAFFGDFTLGQQIEDDSGRSSPDPPVRETPVRPSVSSITDNEDGETVRRATPERPSSITNVALSDSAQYEVISTNHSELSRRLRNLRQNLLISPDLPSPALENLGQMHRPRAASSVYSSGAITLLQRPITEDLLDFVKQKIRDVRVTEDEVVIISCRNGSASYYDCHIESVSNVLFDNPEDRHLAFATVLDQDHIERQDARTILDAVQRDRVAILYSQRSEVGVYAGNDLEGLCRSLVP